MSDILQYGDTRLELNQLENTSAFQYLPPLATITFYEGCVKDTIDYIRERTKKIVEANAWLDSRIVTNKQGKWELQYHCKPSPDVFDYFISADAPELSPDLCYTDVSTIVTNNTRMKANNYVIDRTDIPLFEVLVLKIEPNSFAVIVSISHFLGDGCTYYQIYSMLDRKNPIVGLLPERYCDYDDKVILYGKEEADRMITSSLATIIGLLKNTYFLPKCSVDIFNVDSNAIARLKKELKGDEDFISTNDIITSWWMRYTECDCLYMSMDLRKRIASLSIENAGNYQGILTFTPGESRYKYTCYTPANVRTHLTNYTSCSPSTWTQLKGKFAGITNWCSFFSEVLYEDTKFLRHQPIFDLSSVGFMYYAIIFRPREGQTAILTFTRSPCNQQLESDILLPKKSNLP